MIRLSWKIPVQAGFLFLSLFTLSCVGPAKMAVTDLSDIHRGETIVVGKIELSPPLSSREQALGFTTKEYKNKVIFITDDHFREIDEPGMKDFDGRIEAELGGYFYIKTTAQPFYLLEGIIMMDTKNTGGVQKAYLPAGFKVDLKPGDKAVYIGTLQYFRDEFFDITKITLIDDYEKANEKFKKKFGNNVKLRSALVRQAK